MSISRKSLFVGSAPEKGLIGLAPGVYVHVRRHAYSKYRYNWPRDIADLVQEGVLGGIKATSTYVEGNGSLGAWQLYKAKRAMQEYERKVLSAASGRVTAERALVAYKYKERVGHWPSIKEAAVLYGDVAIARRASYTQGAGFLHIMLDEIEWEELDELRPKWGGESLLDFIDCLLRLKERHREVLVRAGILDEKLRYIAKDWGMTESGVSHILSQARSAFKRAWEADVVS